MLAQNPLVNLKVTFQQVSACVRGPQLEIISLKPLGDAVDPAPTVKHLRGHWPGKDSVGGGNAEICYNLNVKCGYGLFVNAKDQQAKTPWKHSGLVPHPSNELEFFLSVATAQAPPTPGEL